MRWQPSTSISIERLEDRIRTYLRRRFGDFLTVPRVGWRIPLDGELVRVNGPAHAKKAAREHAKQLRAVAGADSSKLTAQEEQVRQAQIRHASAAIGAAKAADKEHKAILGVPAPRPRLETVK